MIVTIADFNVEVAGIACIGIETVKAAHSSDTIAKFRFDSSYNITR